MKAFNSTLSVGKGFKNKGSQLKRTPMRKVGRVGKANIAANRKIKKIADETELTTCEIGQLSIPELTEVECLGSFTLQTAHRHKRSWYKGDPKLLSETRQWVKACQNCHERIEHDAELTEEVFTRLRGEEELPEDIVK